MLTGEQALLAPEAAAWSNRFSPAAGPMRVIPTGDDILKSVLHFKWTILVVSILVAAPLIAAIWTWFVPMFRVRAEVRVRPIIPYLVFQTEESGKIPLYDAFVNTQVPIITSVPVLQRVLDQRQVQQTQWYQNPLKSLLEKLDGNPVPPIEKLKDALSAVPRKETEIIDVTFTDSRARDAELILNMILDQYVRYIAEMSDATEDKVFRTLVDQNRSLETDILGREKLIDELRTSLGTAIPEELISQKRIRLDEMQARLAGVQQNIDLLQWELNQFRAQDGNDPNLAVAGDMDEQPEYFEDEEWRRLDANVKLIQHEIEAGSRKAGHPDTIRAQKEVKFAEEMLRQREAQLDQQWRQRTVPITIAGADPLSRAQAVDYLEHQLARAEHEKQLLLPDIDKQQTEFKKLFESAQLLEKQSVALTHKRELYDAVRQRLDQKNTERNAPGSIEILTRAVVPSLPYNDRRIIFSVMVTVLALGLGGGVAYLRAGRNQAVYAPKDMPYPLQVPFLGYVPELRRVKATNGQAGGAMIEAIRVVRTALLSRLNGQACPEPGRGDSAAVLITSADAGTGKSHFTMMLGESLAQARKRVLLIDADLRKMALTKRFDLANRSGFVDCLRCRSVHKEYIYPTETYGLSIMPAGEKGENGAAVEETSNGAFQTCIEQLRQDYDVILLDAPPMQPLADAAILSNQVDGTIMVERQVVSRRMDEIDALVRLASGGGRLIGTVFVGSNPHGKYE
ncbi:MAG: hypothetical protein A2Z25_02705 [Planctomycetes bacterium RBG_16_55_9]|nr:MAG: hypothetical protein A2Z25_02705 [Planctomycetes bacterium RBG_16_55_9]